MQTIFKKMYQGFVNYLNRPKTIRILQSLAIMSLASLASNAFAADLLAGTDTTLLDTLNGTGKKYLYIGECVVSLLAYIQTKNVVVLVGIIVVAIFFNIMITMVK